MLTVSWAVSVVCLLVSLSFSNLEYMSSGTPVLTSKLPGMPKEYHKYVFLFEEETIEGYSKTLAEVLDYPTEVLIKKGQDAKEFVLSKKNNKIQTKKILELSQRI